MGTPMQSGARHRVRGSICLLGSLPALVAVQWKPAKQAAVRNTLIPGSCANVLHITFTQHTFTATTECATIRGETSWCAYAYSLGDVG